MAKTAGDRLLPPVTEQKPAHVFAPVWQHALYGIVTVAAYRQLQKFAVFTNQRTYGSRRL